MGNDPGGLYGSRDFYVPCFAGYLLHNAAHGGVNVSRGGFPKQCVLRNRRKGLTLIYEITFVHLRMHLEHPRPYIQMFCRLNDYEGF